MPRQQQLIDPTLLARVSRLYYDQNFLESEIAEKLHISRSKVSRLLKEARQRGIVQINIIPPPSSFPSLEAELEKRYGLMQAIVVDCKSLSVREIIKTLGIAAAQHLQDTIKPGETIGLSWGRTLRAMTDSMIPKRTRNNKVVQIIGGLGNPSTDFYATELSRKLANALSTDFALLPVPGIMATKAAKDAILTDYQVLQTIKLFSEIDVAYVGIGAPGKDSVLLDDNEIINKDDLDNVISMGAVGDIALRFFDDSGKSIQSDLDERIIGINLNELQNIERRIGVAGGIHKVDTVQAALLGEHINVLITDQILAEALVTQPKPKPLNP